MSAPTSNSIPDRIDSALFRHVMSHFCSGVVVITASSRGGPVGLTCQSFVSLSLDPPLVLFAVARTSRSWPRIRSSRFIAVNILQAAQRGHSESFARTGTDKFAGLSWHPGRYRAPLLVDALAHIECRLEAVHDGGDHEIVIGRVLAVRADAESTDPLLYYRSEYRRLVTE